MRWFGVSSRYGTGAGASWRWWAVAVILVFGVGCRPTPVNVVLVSVDTLRADHLNCYGYARRKVSPSIDALAEDGVLFESFVTSSPWTTPAHLSMMTSLYPSSHGVTAPFRDLEIALSGQGEYQRLGDETITMAEQLKGIGFATAAFTAGGPLSPEIGFGRGFDIYRTTMYKLDNDNMAEMLDWLAHARKPFFLFWHHYEVHAPYLETTFANEVLDSDVVAALEQRLERHRSSAGPELNNDLDALKAALEELDAFRPEVCEALYDGGIVSADARLGQLVAHLKSLGIYDQTLIVLLSDHGEEFADHYPDLFFNRHGHSLFEEMVHVPLIIKLPGQRCAGARVEEVASTVDVMPTVLRAVRADERPDQCDGRALQELWDGSAHDERDAFMEALAYATEEKGVRRGRLKLVYFMSEDQVARFGRNALPPPPLPGAVFDLEADPGERTSLTESPSPAPHLIELVAEMDRALRAQVALRRGKPAKTRLGAETIERLRALGYVEE